METDFEPWYLTASFSLLNLRGWISLLQLSVTSLSHFSEKHPVLTQVSFNVLLL